MKRLILILSVLVFSCVTMFAQDSPTTKLYTKYGGKDGFTTVSISKELFGMFSSIDSEDPEMKDVKAMMEQLEGIRILMYEAGDANDSQLKSFREELSKFNLEGFSELMVVKEKGEEVRFMAKKKGDKIGELLLIIDEGNEAGFISITGLIDMNTVAKLSKTMKLEGMDKLEKLEEK